MKKTYNSFEEHYLVPAVLILVNICVVHLIYALAASSYTPAGKIMLTLSFVLFGAALLFKGKTLLSGSVLFYAFTTIFLIVA